MTHTADFGTISHGTMRAEDLIPAFAYELNLLGRGEAVYMSNLSISGEVFQAWIEAQDIRDELILEANDILDYDSDEAQQVLEALFDALSEYAPRYGYFGTHPGDGSDYGFWLDVDWNIAARDNDALIVDNPADIPGDYSGEAFVVNDHGNVTLYDCRDGKYESVWAVV